LKIFSLKIVRQTNFGPKISFFVLVLKFW